MRAMPSQYTNDTHYTDYKGLPGPTFKERVKEYWKPQDDSDGN